MSTDCLIANLDRHEFFRPADMGLNGDIRAIENVPTIFHIAMARYLATVWAGCRIAIIHEMNGATQSTLPTWESIMGREFGWKSVVADVFAHLFHRHSPPIGELLNGARRGMVLILEKHVEGLRSTLVELEHDAAEGDDVHAEQAGISRELEHTMTVLADMKAKLAESESHERGAS